MGQQHLNCRELAGSRDRLGDVVTFALPGLHAIETMAGPAKGNSRAPKAFSAPAAPANALFRIPDYGRQEQAPARPSPQRRETPDRSARAKPPGSPPLHC